MKIAFLGDIALIGKYNIVQNQKAKDRLKILADKLKEYDYVVGNLESPLTDVNRTLVCKSMHLKSSPENVELLKYLNIDALSLANNHLFDYGMSGLEETIEVLENNNIDWFGVNKRNILKVVQGEKISLSGYACYSTNGSGYRKKNSTVGIHPLMYDTIVKQLKEDQKNSAYSILSIHWGDEHTNYPKYEHIELAKKIVNNKDVIIHGHHPHVIQGIQQYKNSIISYSLGNFIFDDCVSKNGKFALKQNVENKKSFILEVTLENGTIVETSHIGLRETKDAFEFFDIEKEIKEISSKLNQISSINEYENRRLMQINDIREEKFGKRDLKWLISRLNYFAIGARIANEIRKRKYNEISKKFK